MPVLLSACPWWPISRNTTIPLNIPISLFPFWCTFGHACRQDFCCRKEVLFCRCLSVLIFCLDGKCVGAHYQCTRDLGLRLNLDHGWAWIMSEFGLRMWTKLSSHWCIKNTASVTVRKARNIPHRISMLLFYLFVKPVFSTFVIVTEQSLGRDHFIEYVWADRTAE